MTTLPKLFSLVIQPDGNNAKAYQVKQVRNIILRYDLKI